MSTNSMANNRLSNIKLLVGLGNPGKEYEYTYHNVGRLFADYFLANLPPMPSTDGLKFKKPSAQKHFEYLKTENIIFARPLVFMNESGIAVQATLKFFGVKPEELLVIHDDSDIELEKWKISFGRGAGGHKGTESIIRALKTKDFWRLRIGIRRGPTQTVRRQTQTTANNFPRKSALRKKAADFVLKKINPADEKTLCLAFRDIRKKFFEW